MKTPQNTQSSQVTTSKLAENADAQKTVAKVDAAKLAEQKLAEAAQEAHLAGAKTPETAPKANPANQPAPQGTETPKPAQEANPAPQTPAKPAQQADSAKKTKTQGIFEIRSKFDPAKFLRGASSQCEICSRDYLSWCLKNKAPKILQAEFDRIHATQPALTPAQIFEVKILKACPKIDDLQKAKTEFGLTGQARPANEPAVQTPETALAQIQSLSQFAGFQDPKWAQVTDLLKNAANALAELISAPAK